jgi:preprotein translocase subunit SecG
MNILINVLLVVDMIVALLMILVILMQRPKSEGLGAAFGGGVTENIFGAQTTNVLTKITGWLAGIFFVFTFVLSILYAQYSMGGSNLRRELMRGQGTAGQAPVAPSAAPNASAAPAASATPVPANASLSPSSKPSDLAAGAVPQPAPATSVTPAATSKPSP